MHFDVTIGTKEYLANAIYPCDRDIMGECPYAVQDCNHCKGISM